MMDFKLLGCDLKILIVEYITQPRFYNQQALTNKYLGNLTLNKNQSSLKRGYTASFSERIGSLIGQSIAKSVSLHKIPRSFLGE